MSVVALLRVALVVMAFEAGALTAARAAAALGVSLDTFWELELVCADAGEQIAAAREQRVEVAA